MSQYMNWVGSCKDWISQPWLCFGQMYTRDSVHFIYHGEFSYRFHSICLLTSVEKIVSISHRNVHLQEYLHMGGKYSEENDLKLLSRRRLKWQLDHSGGVLIERGSIVMDDNPVELLLERTHWVVRLSIPIPLPVGCEYVLWKTPPSNPCVAVLNFLSATTFSQSVRKIDFQTNVCGLSHSHPSSTLAPIPFHYLSSSSLQCSSQWFASNVSFRQYRLSEATNHFI